MCLSELCYSRNIMDSFMITFQHIEKSPVSWQLPWTDFQSQKARHWRTGKFSNSIVGTLAASVWKILGKMTVMNLVSSGWRSWPFWNCCGRQRGLMRQIKGYVGYYLHYAHEKLDLDQILTTELASSGASGWTLKRLECAVICKGCTSRSIASRAVEDGNIRQWAPDWRCWGFVDRHRWYSGPNIKESTTIAKAPGTV